MAGLLRQIGTMRFNLIIGLVTLLIVLVGILIYLSYRLFRSPFQYPYYKVEFDVSGKRNVDIVDCIDRLLCNKASWNALVRHNQSIEQWKRSSELFLRKSRLKRYRTRQYYRAIDDAHAYCFTTIRSQTRYRQQSYVRTSYKVAVPDVRLSVDWHWLENRYRALKAIGFEATLKEYNSKKQRSLMTPALRRQIMERDNYTCQICGKYMPDEVGLHIDHITPVSKGGKSVPSNLRVLCSKCNGHKGAK